MDEETKARLDRCRAIRGGHRGVVTKLTKEIDEILSQEMLNEEHYIRLNVIDRQLEAKSSVLADLDKEVLGCCDAGEIEGEIDESETVTAKIMGYKAKIDSVKRTKTKEPSHTPIAGRESSSMVAKPRLPKLTLPTFRGDVTRWVSFWDSYNSAIHSNSQLSKIDKFNYLQGLLDGAAARSIKGLTLTEANYDSAIELLQKRFGRPKQIVASHMDELIKIPVCTNDRPQSLRSVYDQITVHIRGLAALEITSEQYGSLLMPMIMSKLPSDIRLQVARELTDENWKIDKLMEVIHKEVEARESSEGTKIKSQPVNPKPHVQSHGPPISSAFVTQGHNIQCVYCSDHHYSASCDKVKFAKDRKDILLKGGRCFNCLKPNHKTRDCRSQRTCRNCHQRHHQSICDNLIVETKQFVQPPTIPPTNTTTDHNNLVSSTTTNAVEERKMVLLQTAQAIAGNETDRRETHVRVLFDSGSQRSYITEDLCHSLRLTPVQSEKLHLNTFGDTRFKPKQCKLYKLYLRNSQSEERIEITALSFPVICSTLPVISDISQYSYLCGIQLADSSSSARSTIDVLIGSDFYWQLVGSEIRQGKQGPVAINSKLGWLLSGPLNSAEFTNITSCNLILAHEDVSHSPNDNDQLYAMLKQFWELETIGIVDNMGTSSQADDKFLSDIVFTEGRYHVSLPWKEGHSSVPDHFILSLNRLRSLHRRLLKNPELLQEYDHIIKDQISKGIVERIPEQSNQTDVNLVHYLPHQAVIRRERSTTKLRIVYDGSAKANGQEVSLNDCLQTGPNFIPKLFDVLIKFRSYSFALTADIEKAFLMVGINNPDRDVIRFLWLEDPCKPDSNVLHLHFTRLVFGLRPSPAILGAVITHHLSQHRSEYPHLVEQLEKCLYVDDLITGTNDIEQAFELYQISKRIMKGAGLNLRKWNSNCAGLLKRIRECE